MCVCVCVRERETETERARERQGERGKEMDTIILASSAHMKHRTVLNKNYISSMGKVLNNTSLCRRAVVKNLHVSSTRDARVYVLAMESLLKYDQLAQKLFESNTQHTKKKLYFTLLISQPFHLYNIIQYKAGKCCLFVLARKCYTSDHIILRNNIKT